MNQLEKILQFYPATAPAPRTLTPVQVARYNREGYLAPLETFRPAAAAANREFFGRLMTQADAQGWDRYSLVGWEWTCATIHDLIMNPRILNVVEDLLGPNFLCVGSHFFCKLPGDVKRIAWHQDAPYYQLSPSKSVTAWLAIDDVNEENGAMQVIPRSHLQGEIKSLPSEATEQNVLTHTVHSPETHGDAPVSVNLQAGQFSLHSDLILHGSEPNASARRRCGLAIRYLPTDVRALTDWNRLSVMCRGVDQSGHWANHPRPPGDMVPIRPATGGIWEATEFVPLAGRAGGAVNR